MSEKYRPDIGPVPPVTLSGETYQNVYEPKDVDAAKLQAEAKPGETPFTRGLFPEMYRTRPWTIRQYAGFGSAQETNARYKKLLAAGQTGLSVAFDLPTQLGMDPDHPGSLGEVGRVGVSIATVEDMKRLFEGIDLGKASTSMTINAPAAVLLAFYQVAAEESGVAPDKISGTVQNDILKEYAARHNFIYPAEPSMRLAVDVIEHCAKICTNFYPISVSGYHFREAGCTAPQEIAFTLSDGLAYLQAAQARGLSVDQIAKQFSFFFAATTEFLEEAAKFRAARRLWAKLLDEKFGNLSPKAKQLRFHVQTAGSLLTSQEPENNLVRVAIQTLAAVMGGCQSLHANAFDEALGLPGERSAKLAVATQHILARETNVTLSADPLGGSYAVEQMTDNLEARAREIMAEIEKMGGAPAAVEAGYYQQRIAEAAFKAQRNIETGAQVVVGVNRFAEKVESAKPPSIQKLDSNSEIAAVNELNALKARRSASDVQSALGEIESAARSKESHLPAILNAARARVTLGEICNALRKVHGEYKSRGF